MRICQSQHGPSPTPFRVFPRASALNKVITDQAQHALMRTDAEPPGQKPVCNEPKTYPSEVFAPTDSYTAKCNLPTSRESPAAHLSNRPI